MIAPKWAQELTLNAVLYIQSLPGHGRTELPNLTWRHRQGKESSGTLFYNRNKGISLNAGRLRQDIKLVLLHEIVHWTLPNNEHHSSKFWDLAWELYRWAGLPTRYCLNREKSYRKGAVAAYHRARKGG